LTYLHLKKKNESIKSSYWFTRMSALFITNFQWVGKALGLVYPARI